MKKLTTLVLLIAGTAHAQCDPMSISCQLQQTPREQAPSPSIGSMPSAVDEYRRETERNRSYWNQVDTQRELREQRSRLDALEEQRRR